MPKRVLIRCDFAISGLFKEPAGDEDFLTDMDDECENVIEFHRDFPINFNGEFCSNLYVCILSYSNIM